VASRNGLVELLAQAPLLRQRFPVRILAGEGEAAVGEDAEVVPLDADEGGIGVPVLPALPRLEAVVDAR
jgi:hypothetical protein